MRFSLLEAATAAGRAAEAHIASGCTVCRPGARLAELCPDAQRVVTEAANLRAPGLLEGPCPHESWEVTSERHTPDGWVKNRRCAECRDPLDPVTEPEPHWPAAEPAPATAIPAELTHAEDMPPGPAHLAALMRSRQQWRDGRLVSEGVLTQREIRAVLGWVEEPAPAITWRRDRMDQLRADVRVLTAGPKAFPDCTDTYAARTARRILPELLDLVDVLHARVMDLEAHGCRCYDPTAHAPGCVKAAVRFRGRTYPAAVWYRDQAGDWWAPHSVDARGCLVLQLDGDAGQGPVPLDQVEEEYGPVTASAYGAHVPRGDLPDLPGEAAATLRAHLRACPECRPDHTPPHRCSTGRELARAAAGGHRG